MKKIYQEQKNSKELFETAFKLYKENPVKNFETYGEKMEDVRVVEIPILNKENLKADVVKTFGVTPEEAQPKSVERLKRKRLGFFIEKNFFIRNCKPTGCIKVCLPSSYNGEELHPRFISPSQKVLGSLLTKWWGCKTTLDIGTFRYIQSQNVSCETWEEVENKLNTKIRGVYNNIIEHLNVIDILEKTKPLDCRMMF